MMYLTVLNMLILKIKLTISDFLHDTYNYILIKKKIYLFIIYDNT